MENKLADKLYEIEMSDKQNEILSSLESWESIRSLEIEIEWIIDRLLPKDGITVLFGKGGIGKTWLSMDMARSIGSGLPFLGLQTVKKPVIFVDFENPLAVLNTRTQKLGEADGVFFWRANNDKLKAPKLDKPDYEFYKLLPEGAVLIFDTLRASQDRDENKSDEMGLIMGRLKELRDLGFTIVLLHHTAKNSDRIAKGSTAIVDLADHILGLTLVRKKVDGQEVVVDDEDADGDLLYRFGVREKTRYEPYQIYLSLNPDRGFELAPDPQEGSLKQMHEIICDHCSLNKTEFLEQCKVKTGLSERKVRRLFDIGLGRYWKEDKLSQYNKKMICPIQFCSSAPLYSGEKLKNWTPVLQGNEKTDTEKTQQTLDDSQFCSSAQGICRSEKQAIIEVEGIL